MSSEIASYYMGYVDMYDYDYMIHNMLSISNFEEKRGDLGRARVKATSQVWISTWTSSHWTRRSVSWDVCRPAAGALAPWKLAWPWARPGAILFSSISTRFPLRFHRFSSLSDGFSNRFPVIFSIFHRSPCLQRPKTPTRGLPGGLAQLLPRAQGRRQGAAHEHL